MARYPTLLTDLFPVIWILLGLGLFLFYTFNKNARLKRKVHPWVIGVVAVLLCLVIASAAALAGLPTGALLLVIAALIAVAVLNLKMIKFCDHCGKTVYIQGFAKTETCPHCGQPLRATPPGAVQRGKNEES